MKGGINKMSNLKEEAKAYVPKITLNIADLDKVDLTWPIETRSGTALKQDADGKDYEESYTKKVMVVNEQEYYVPNTVLEEIKKMIELVPELQFVKVEKTGSGYGTKYSVKKVEEEAKDKE